MSDPYRTPPPSPSRNVRARTTCTPVRRPVTNARIRALHATILRLQNLAGNLNRPPISPMEMTAREELDMAMDELEEEIRLEQEAMRNALAGRYDVTDVIHHHNFPPPPPPPTVGTGRKKGGKKSASKTKKGKGGRHSTPFSPPEPAVPIASPYELLLNVRRRLANLRRMTANDLEESISIEGSIRELEAEERRLISILEQEEAGYRIPSRKGKGSKSSVTSRSKPKVRGSFHETRMKPAYMREWLRTLVNEQDPSLAAYAREKSEREQMGAEDVKKGKGGRQSKRVSPIPFEGIVPAPSSSNISSVIRQQQHEMELERQRQHKEGRQMLHEDVRRAERIARQREMRLMGKEDAASKLMELPARQRQAAERHLMEQEEFARKYW